MKHALTRLAPLAAALGLLLSGCGGSDSASTDGATTTASSSEPAKLVKAGLKPPAGCYLTIYLEPTTPAQKQFVETLMLESDRVATVSFVPRTLALKRLAQTEPEIAGRMRLNLFPDTFEVVPRTRLHVAAIITDFAAGVQGVTNVRASRPCSPAA